LDQGHVIVLKALHLRGVGPASQFDVAFADRLNLVTGDNGLGKTFLLDIAWWALTGI
jgi:DNA repair exonuclease SbcCD ATPase subunit